MNAEEQPITTENTPRPFREIPGLWLQIGQMTEAFFTKEVSRASASNALFSILLDTLVSAIMYVIRMALNLVVGSFIPPATSQPTVPFSAITATICFVLIGTPIIFYLNNGITYIIALTFGGKGKFNSQTYLSSLFYVPLGIVASLAGFFTLIPKVGWYIAGIVTLGVVVFDMILRVRSLKVVHSLTAGRAIAVVLLPLLLLLIPICIIVVLMLLGPMIGNVFSSINSSLATPGP